MSHRWNCPDRWTAEREGERAHEYGRGRYSNPYDERHLSSWERDRACPDAARAWEDGHRRAERRAEEAAEEQAAEARAARRRAEADEEAYYEQMYYQQQQQYPPEPQIEEPSPDKDDLPF